MSKDMKFYVNVLWAGFSKIIHAKQFHGCLKI